MTRAIYDITARCAWTYEPGQVCGVAADAHVHCEPPCVNGQDARHHDYTPPKSVTVQIDGQRYRVRLRAIAP